MIDYNVSQLAKMLQRSRASITALIESGKIDGYDSAPDGRYRQYRVTPAALEKFRAINKAKKPAANQRRKMPAAVKEFY